MMKKWLLAGAMVVAASGVFAAGDPIAERKEILKGFGDLTKPNGAALKGEAAFDLAKAQAALKAYSAGSKKLVTLFPDNSKTGGKTEALPSIWQNKAKFDGIYAKLDKDATDALAAIKDEASFKANFGKVLGNCKACHDDFREKK